MERTCFIEGCEEKEQQSGVCHDHYENGFFYHDHLA